MCEIITGTKNYFPDEKDRHAKVFDYMDRLMKIFPDFDNFHIHDYYKEIESNETERRKLTSLSTEIRIAMQKLGYIKNPPEFNALFILTDKGREVKTKGGHFKYVKSLEMKTDWMKIIPIILTILFGTFTSIFIFKSYKLNKENNITKVENIGLKNQVDSLKIILNKKK